MQDAHDFYEIIIDAIEDDPGHHAEASDVWLQIRAFAPHLGTARDKPAHTLNFLQDSFRSNFIAFRDVKKNVSKIDPCLPRPSNRERALWAHPAALRAASNARPSRSICSNSSGAISSEPDASPSSINSRRRSSLAARICCLTCQSCKASIMTSFSTT